MPWLSCGCCQKQLSTAADSVCLLLMLLQYSHKDSHDQLLFCNMACSDVAMEVRSYYSYGTRRTCM